MPENYWKGPNEVFFENVCFGKNFCFLDLKNINLKVFCRGYAKFESFLC
jgi:hypothetical protein